MISMFHKLFRWMTYASEKMFLEIELDVRVLLDNSEYLDCLFDNLNLVCELFLVARRGMLLPQVRHRHLRQWSQ
jgi:hypothetical protein